jgi:xylulokinase
MFLSDVFTECFVNTLNVPVEIYNCDGSIGAAIGAGIGAKIYTCPKEAFRHFTPERLVEPDKNNNYNDYYSNWLQLLGKQLN